jgi:hypothetical protein
MVGLEAALLCSPLSMVGLDPTTQTFRTFRKGLPNLGWFFLSNQVSIFATNA